MKIPPGYASDDDLRESCDFDPPGADAPLSEIARRAMHAPIEIAKWRFELTRNPLFAWEAWQAARSLQAPVPDWVLAYLDRVAESLLRIKDSPDLPTALELAGRGPSAQARRRSYYGRLAVAQRVYELLDAAWLKDEKLSVRQATITAAEQLNVDIEMARKAVREAKRRNIRWFAQ